MHGVFIENPISFANIVFITLLVRIDDIANKMSKMVLDLHTYIVFLVATHKVGIGMGIHLCDKAVVDAG